MPTPPPAQPTNLVPNSGPAPPGEHGSRQPKANASGVLISSEEFPAVPVRSLAIHAGDSKRIYAGTEIGLFYSRNGGQLWTIPPIAGLKSCPIDELLWLGSELIAATHGRGLFRVDQRDPLP
jgi:hypothetical protein